MAKIKSPERKGTPTPDPFSVPHVPYVDKFWKDYTNEEYRGLNQVHGWVNRRHARRVVFIVLLVFVVFLAALYIVAKLTALP